MNWRAGLARGTALAEPPRAGCAYPTAGQLRPAASDLRRWGKDRGLRCSAGVRAARGSFRAIAALENAMKN